MSMSRAAPAGRPKRAVVCVAAHHSGTRALGFSLIRASVVIPTFNYAKWLPDAIESALAQAPMVDPADVIIVDDGSTDETPRVVAKQFPSVRYVRQDNAGLAAARNTGLGLVTTELVCFLDSDDTIPPQFIRDLADVLDAQPESIGFAYSGVRYTGSASEQSPAAAWSIQELRRENFVSATSLFRVAAIGTTRFDSHIRGWEDWDFALSLVERGITGIPVDSCAFNYRKHWDDPGMLDVLWSNGMAPRARRYVARKHRALYPPRDRLSAEAAVLVALLRDIKASLTARMRR